MGRKIESLTHVLICLLMEKEFFCFFTLISLLCLIALFCVASVINDQNIVSWVLHKYALERIIIKICYEQ